MYCERIKLCQEKNKKQFYEFKKLTENICHHLGQRRIERKTQRNRQNPVDKERKKVVAVSFDNCKWRKIEKNYIKYNSN